MKKLVIAFLIFVSLPFFSNAQKINWISFEEAVRLNETAPKKIFIDVYTDWCGWCKKMDKVTYQDSTVVAYINENFYAVQFDAECNDTIVFADYTFVNDGGQGGRRGTHQLAMALLQGQMSYPSCVFMNEKNHLITVVPGYREPKDFMPILKYFCTDAYLNQTFSEFNK